MQSSERPMGRGTPRWVKVSAGIALALILLLVVLMAVGGSHGPGRHLGDDSGRPADTPPGHEKPSWVPDH